jgi:hypothetical protein
MLAIETPATLLDELLLRICSKLQLTPTQQEMAEDRYLAAGRWVAAEGSTLHRYHPQIFPQGSLRIGTTVKPLAREEFDLDFVLQLEMEWRNPILVLDEVEARFRAHDTYRDMIERKNRCIRLNYKNDFYMDVLPARPDRTALGTCLLVPDRELHIWVPSNPKGFAAWFESREAVRRLAERVAIEPLHGVETLANKSPLQLAVQLWKRHRDIDFRDRPKLAPVSIVLTTLAGLHYNGEQSVYEALLMILTRTLGSLPSSGRLSVCNPSNPKEDLADRWNRPEAYRAFVNSTQDLLTRWQRLPQTVGIDETTTTLKLLFGEKVTLAAVRDHAVALEQKRSAQELAVRRNTGLITSTATSAAVPIKRNTFFGD